MIQQHILAAQTVEFSSEDARLVEAHLESLAAVGFELEPFGPAMYTIRAIPAMLSDRDPVAVVKGIVDDLSLEKTPGQDAIERKIIRRVCRHAAVKAGQILSRDEMQGIIRQLERCESPHTCPHGRPTMLHMSGERLAREFGRS